MRFAVHFLLSHGVKLFEFAQLPIVPIGKTKQFLSSKTPNSLFFMGPMAGCINGSHDEKRTIVVVRLWIICRWCGLDGIDYLKLINGYMASCQENKGVRRTNVSDVTNAAEWCQQRRSCVKMQCECKLGAGASENHFGAAKFGTSVVLKSRGFIPIAKF